MTESFWHKFSGVVEGSIAITRPCKNVLLTLFYHNSLKPFCFHSVHDDQEIPERLTIIHFDGNRYFLPCLHLYWLKDSISDAFLWILFNFREATLKTKLGSNNFRSNSFWSISGQCRSSHRRYSLKKLLLKILQYY